MRMIRRLVLYWQNRALAWPILITSAKNNHPDAIEMTEDGQKKENNKFNKKKL